MPISGSWSDSSNGLGSLPVWMPRQSLELFSHAPAGGELEGDSDSGTNLNVTTLSACTRSSLYFKVTTRASRPRPGTSLSVPVHARNRGPGLICTFGGNRSPVRTGAPAGGVACRHWHGGLERRGARTLQVGRSARRLGTPEADRPQATRLVLSANFNGRAAMAVRGRE
jgi:hypothetical protein